MKILLLSTHPHVSVTSMTTKCPTNYFRFPRVIHQSNRKAQKRTESLAPINPEISSYKDAITFRLVALLLKTSEFTTNLTQSWKYIDFIVQEFILV